MTVTPPISRLEFDCNQETKINLLHDLCLKETFKETFSLENEAFQCKSPLLRSYMQEGYVLCVDG